MAENVYNEFELIAQKELDQQKECDVTTFKSRKKLLHFCIDSDLSLNMNKSIPRLKKKFYRNRSQLNVDLKKGYRSALTHKKLMEDYYMYRIIKWILFLEVLKTHEIIEEEKPTIVALDETLAAMVWFCNWHFYALKFKGVIYLFLKKTVNYDKDYKKENYKYNINGYYGLKFLYLITERDESDINQFEKYFNVDRIHSNGNKLIVLNEINAIDRSGNPVEIYCEGNLKKGREFFQKNLLDKWSQKTISNAKTVVVGRRKKSLLKTTTLTDLDEIATNQSFWSVKNRFSVLQQSIDFIKSCVDLEQQLYCFAYKKDTKILEFSKVNEPAKDSTFFLPPFYRE